MQVPVYAKAPLIKAVCYGLYLLSASLQAGQIESSQISDHSEISDSMMIKVFSMSIKELLDLPITSATNTDEKLTDAPAVVIVITQQQIQSRGYFDLVELFDDLPGIDTSITYGDLYFRPYWRGLRKGVSSGFLFMIDGMVMNHLYYNWTDIMVAVPLSFIKQVEVVYGPASAVYGANAMMGVINVITEKGKDLKKNQRMDLKVAAGSNKTKVFDLNYTYHENNWGMRLNAFINQGDLDKDSLDNYIWTDPDLLSNQQLWGGVLDNPELAGKASSPRKIRSLSAAGFIGGSEVGVQHFHVETGFALDYAFDKIQIQTPWIEEDTNWYFKNSTKLNDQISSNTLLRYRESNIPNNSVTLDGYQSAEGSRLISMTYWQSLNSSWSVEQSFDIDIDKNLRVKSGINYEDKDLNKAFDTSSGPAVKAVDFDPINYPYPVPPEDTKAFHNRANWEYQGLFVQAKYNLKDWLNASSDQLINLGMRHDKNSFYGTENTLRAGYVGQFNQITAKILYGEAIQEPTPRELYGGWSGAGSSLTLSPELSTTYELYLSYTNENYQLAINPYLNRFKDSILSLVEGPANIASSEALGVDLHFHWQVTGDNSSTVRYWAYYSYLDAEEDKYDLQGNKIGKGTVPDMAKNKLHFGVTGQLLDKRLNVNLRGRYIDDKPTVETNPVPKVNGYFTVDANFTYTNLFAKGLDISLKINNLFDRQYFHPGVRDASAGNTAGYFDEQDIWHGSEAWSNSLLPQPGRSFTLALQGNF